MHLQHVWSAACLGGVLLLAGCGGDSSDDAGAEATGSSTSADGATSPSPTAPAGDAQLAGRLLFSRFDESTHTFLSTHVSRPDGSQETEIPMPGSEGGGRWSTSGDHIAVSTELNDGRIGTAIISPRGSVVRVFEIPEDGLNLACTAWAPNDKRLACEGWDDTDASRGGIYTVRSSDGGGLVRLTKTPPDMNDLPGDYSPDGTTVLFKRSVGEDPGPLMVAPAAGGRARQLTDLTWRTRAATPATGRRS